MARVSRPLVLSEEDVNALEELKEYGDKEMCLRAQIILACAESRTNKSIAQELSLTEATVKKWKEAYREKGLQGLKSEHTGGRPSSSPAPVDLENTVLDMLAQCTDERPTAAEIAERLQVDVSKVYYLLRKNGINLSRDRCWEYTSRDDMGEWDPPILFLYLSPNRTLIVTSSNPWPGDARPAQGVLVTHDKALKQALERSVVPVSLAGILKTASELSDSTSARDVKPGPAMEEAISQWDGDKEAEFFIFCSGNAFTYGGLRAKKCHVYCYESVDEMITSFLHWMGGKCNSFQHSKAELLMDEICRFSRKQQASSQPFIWYLRQKGASDPAGTVESTTRDETEGYTDPLIFPDAKSWSNIEEMLLALLPELNSSEPATEAGALLYQRGSDGNLMVRLVQSERKFQAMEEFDLGSKEGFERDMSRLEQDTEAFLYEISGVNYNMFLDGSKKNKTGQEFS